MKLYLMITTDKVKFILTEPEKEAVFKAVAAAMKFVFIQDSLIALTIPPTVIEYDRWFAQENERLRERGKRLCKKCGSIMDNESGCECWGRNGFREKNPIMTSLPDEMKAQIKGAVKDFPKLLN